MLLPLESAGKEFELGISNVLVDEVDKSLTVIVFAEYSSVLISFDENLKGIASPVLFLLGVGFPI